MDDPNNHTLDWYRAAVDEALELVIDQLASLDEWGRLRRALNEWIAVQDKSLDEMAAEQEHDTE